ncbi:unnamed protein product [Adineta steineri]|uniref:Uncharacterized protein n=1 Tax=Adineta steineri TaxID=433720 RepID=A0A819GJI7_9BILA|nr:unnamed protein product [Adineta steineri]CAF0981061.1 unnamed protein product [Adineta steineri]CAF1051141.1 unnamed protein product [Adineta steineri]CAF3809633.1 unnamed protein product [Adineta steineri]CAF3863890.1 unnamed protein product [Adineta steineri]
MNSTTKQNWNRATVLFLIVSIGEILINYVRRNETVCCLIGFGIGVGCCILYRLISNFLTPSINIISPYDAKISLSSTSKRKREHSISIKHEHNDRIRNNTISDDMTWSEMSSSLSTVNLLHDSYHSNSLTGDSGVDCPEIPYRTHQQYDDEIKKYDSDSGIHHDTQKVTESHVMSYISTEKGLERALEQTSRFYTDLEHIAIDLGTLTKRYSQSESSLVHHSIDALDWDWLDDMQTSPPLIQSPKNIYRKQCFTRSANKNKVRRRLHTNMNQTEYYESDHENRSFDYSTSPLRRKHSSVYFGSTDNTSDDDNIGDETLQIKS